MPVGRYVTTSRSYRCIIESQGARFVKGYDDVPRAATLFTHPRLRLGGAEPAGPDHQQRSNKEYRREKQRQRKPRPAAAVPLYAIHHTPPVYP